MRRGGPSSLFDTLKKDDEEGVAPPRHSKTLKIDEEGVAPPRRSKL